MYESFFGGCALSSLSTTSDHIPDDTETFRDGLRKLGFSVHMDSEKRFCTVEGMGGKLPKTHGSVWTNSAGTAARFLLALCAASHGSFFFDGTEQLRRRPMGPLVKALSALGAEFHPSGATRLPLRVISKGLRGGFLASTGNATSSQFLSSLLMVATLAQADVEVDLSGVVSRPYVDMTVRMMAQFGVAVTRNGDRITVPAGQRYQPIVFEVEPDSSTASYFYAVAAISAGNIRVPRLWRSTSIQGDVGFLDILEKAGCIINEDGSGTAVIGPHRLKPVNVNMDRISDTFMTLAAMAPFAEGTTRIEGIAHTRFQESDRISAMEEGLTRLRVPVRAGPNWIEIDGCEPKGGIVSAHNDHRVAMSLALVGLRVPGVVIDGAECVAKTCPDYFDRLRRVRDSVCC